MAIINGIDVPQAVFAATQGVFARGTLTSIDLVQRASDGPDIDRRVEETHAFEGVLDTRRLRNREGTLTGQVEAVVLVFAASLPRGVVPRQGDRIALQGTSGTIAAVVTDPGEATHACSLSGA